MQPHPSGILSGNISLRKYIISNSVIEKILQINEKVVFCRTQVSFLCAFLLDNCRGLSFLHLESIIQCILINLKAQCISRMYLSRYLNYGSYWVYQIVRLNKQDLWTYFNFQRQHVAAKLLWWCGGWEHWIIGLYCLHDNTWCVHIHIYMMHIYDVYIWCIYIYIYKDIW